jgi:hypothetical protein
MPNAQDVLWFKSEFQPQIESQIAGTPFSVDMLTAFACQETGGIWPVLRKEGLATARILELCVGDTIDASPTGGGRRAFPKNKAELLSVPGGDRMFEVARQGLVDMAEHIRDYRGAAARPDKFCHGFGIFQLDLQFFKTQPDYFLERHYADFDLALARCVGELKAALKRLGWQAKTSLSENEMAAVAIAYNTGGFNPARGLKQGYFDGTKYYGENYLDFLRLAKSAQVGTPMAAPRGAGSRAKRAVPAATTAARTGAAKKAAAKKTTATKKTARKTSAKKAATKAATKKGATKKAATKAKPTKVAPKKAAPKKAAPKKAVAKSAGATRVAAKKAARRR